MKIISIIIATFNASNTIERCLKSIISQKTSEIEIVVVDGLSEDDTISIVNKYRKHIDILISERDNGIYDAWNKGVKNSTGKWLMFLGADDVLMSNCFNTQLNWLNTHKIDSLDIISGKANLVSKDGTFVKVIGMAYNWRKFRYRMTVTHGSTLHNRDLFKSVGLFDINFKICGDYELLLRRPLHAGFIDECLIQMQTGGLSTTLAARKEPFRARRKNNIFPLWKNFLIREREVFGYVLKDTLLKLGIR